jgi:hypothetical protein
MFTIASKLVENKPTEPSLAVHIACESKLSQHFRSISIMSDAMVKRLPLKVCPSMQVADFAADDGS